MTDFNKQIVSRRLVGIIGLLSVFLFLLTVLIIGLLNNNFSFINDFVSKLGAKGEPYAFWFNLIGFVIVGILLFVFGWLYGRFLEDRLLSILLSFFGLGFAFTAIPIDMTLSRTSVSKAHIVAICLALAFWLFGLSRLGYNQNLPTSIRNRANITAVILVSAMIGFVLSFWSMPITHRLVFGIVLLWTAITSIELLTPSNAAKTLL